MRITTPSKTLVDGLDRPDLCGGIIELAKGLERYASDTPDWEQLSADARQLDNRTVFKRLGYLTEVLGLEVSAWRDLWRAEISPGESLLDPRYGHRGVYSARWNLRLNLNEEQLLEWRKH